MKGVSRTALDCRTPTWSARTFSVNSFIEFLMEYNDYGDEGIFNALIINEKRVGFNAWIKHFRSTDAPPSIWS
jgi:hypothetical protein